MKKSLLLMKRLWIEIDARWWYLRFGKGGYKGGAQANDRPKLLEDEKLGELSPSVRLLFMGLISQADDEGRLKGHPGLVKSLIYPYDMDITHRV